MDRQAYAKLLREFHEALDRPSDEALPIVADLSRRMATLVKTWDDEKHAREMQQVAYDRRIGA